MKPTCSVVDCSTSARTKGWCEKHYRRWYRTGSALTVRPPGYTPSLEPCQVVDCDSRAEKSGMCGKHYQRRAKGKNPAAPLFRSGPECAIWLDRDRLTYDALHERIRRIRGSAKAHLCISCGTDAHQWAYQHTDNDPLVSTVGLSKGCEFTDDLNAYAPMCRSCHARLDAQWRVLKVEQEAEAS